MKFKQIYIEDFGIIQNQTLKDIDHNIVVIGGLNRAGKTTFHHLLKNIGYGFSKGATLPPPKFQYSVTADLILENKETYSIKTQGFSEPKINCTTNKLQPIPKASDIFNIDFYTYCRIFNINLKELNNINKNDRKLQSTLLGAGFKEVISMPSIIDELAKEADKIGGKQGKCDTKMFKNYYSLISDGISLKKAASDSVKEYAHIKEQLICAEGKLNLTEKDMHMLKSKIIVLDTLVNFHETYKKRNELEYILENSNNWNFIKSFDTTNLEILKNLRMDYIDTINDYSPIRYKFMLETKGDISLYNNLINDQMCITSFYNNISGIKEKLKNYEKTLFEYENESNSIKIHMNSINKNWNNNFNEILSIDSDLISLDNLNLLIEKSNFLNEELKNIQKSIENLNFQISLMENKNNETITNNNNKTMFYIIVIFIIIALSTFSFVFYKLELQNNYIFLLLYILLALIIFLSSVYLKKIIYTESKNKNKEFKNEINKLDAEIDDKEMLREKLNKEMLNINEEFKSYINILKTNNEISPIGIREYLKNVQELKKSILALSLRRKRLEDYALDIRNEVGEIELELNKLTIINNNEVNKKANIIDHSQYILKELENCKNYLETAKDFYYIECKKNEIENKIIKIINADNVYKKLFEYNLELQNNEYSDAINTKSHEDFLKIVDSFLLKVDNYKQLKLINDEIIEITSLINATLQSQYIKESFSFFYNDDFENTITLFDRAYNTYFSLDEVIEDFNKCKVNYDELLMHRENLKNTIQSLKDKLNGLMVDENLEKGQYKINEGREGLRPLTEKYAINNAAAFMLQRVYDNFLNDAKDSLLYEASSIMKSITSYEYDRIILGSELENSDFSTILDDGTIKNCTDVLSTATREQLFLSMRLSRIKSFDCRLPVIIDDSFVNFDIRSLKNSIKILQELSKTNQILILTCHPHIVKYINEVCSDAQFWILKKGEFQLSNANDLEKYLS